MGCLAAVWWLSARLSGGLSAGLLWGPSWGSFVQMIFLWVFVDFCAQDELFMVFTCVHPSLSLNGFGGSGYRTKPCRDNPTPSLYALYINMPTNEVEYPKTCEQEMGDWKRTHRAAADWRSSDCINKPNRKQI